MERHDLVSDAIFGLKYPDSRYRFFVVEADRAKERVKTVNYRIKSFQRTLDQYRVLQKEKLYQEHFGITGGLLVLNVTTLAGRMKSQMELVAERSANGKNSYMLFQTAPQFGMKFAPKEPLTHLLTDPWERVGHPAFLINTP